MDRNTIEQFFELIRSGLWERPADPEMFRNGADWKALLRIASMQSLNGIFADGVDTLPSGLTPPPDIARQLFVTLESTRRANLRLESVLAELVTLLRSHGIEGILLKGQGLARDYPEPHHRMCGDIDFYTGSDYERSVSLILGMDGCENGEEDCEKHFHLTYKGCTIEIHRHVAVSPDPFRNRRLQRWADSLLGDPSALRGIEIDGVRVNLPPVAFDSVFILLHLSEHLLWGGIGLRQLCDWCRYMHVHRGEIDRTRLECDLRMLGLMNIWRILGWIAVNRLGLPAEEMPFYSPESRKKALGCLQIILRQGNFGHYDPVRRASADSGFLRRKALNGMKVVHQQSELFRLLPREVLSYLPWYLADGVRRIFTGK